MDPTQPKRCGAKLRGKDKTCHQWPVKGRERCRLHGGMTPQGPASPQWKDGRRSKWSRAFGDAISPEHRASLMDMANGIRSQEYAIDTMRERMETGAAIDFREEVRDIRTAFDAGEFEAIEDCLDTIEGDLVHGRRDDHRIKQISEASAKLTTQQKAVADVHYAAKNVLAPEDARLLIRRMTEIAAEEAGKDVAARIITRLDKELAFGGSGQPQRVVEAS